MGCKSSKSVNVVVPTRTEATTSLMTSFKTDISPDLRSAPRNNSNETPRPSFSEYLSPTERFHTLDTSVINENLDQSLLEKNGLKPKGEKRRVSILDSIHQQIREDDLKVKEIRTKERITREQQSRIVYQIKINGKLVAETSASSSRKDNLSPVMVRKPRERSMTETTDHSIATKRATSRSSQRRHQRKSSDGSVRTVNSIIGSIKPGLNSMPELNSKNNDPIDLLRVPTPERVRIKLTFEKNTSFSHLNRAVCSDSGGNTPEKSGLSSFSSISQE